MRQLTAIKVPFAGQTHLLISLSSRHLFLPRSPCPSSFVSCSRYSSHLYVRVAGLFPSSSHVRPTQNPLRSPVALSLPSSFFFGPPSSPSVLLLFILHSLFFHLRFYRHLHYRPRSLPSPTLSRFRSFWKTRGFPRNFLGSVPPWLSNELVHNTFTVVIVVAAV